MNQNLSPKGSKGWWKDITTNHITGHYVGKDFRQTVAFLCGLSMLYMVMLVAFFTAMYSPKGEAVVLPWEPGAVLVMAGLGYAYLKIMDSLNNRKTADANGNPLAVPGTTPPEPMPQVVNPNAPAAAETDGADGPTS